MESHELYQEIILDHHHNPRCRGVLCGADASSSLLNPLCGDTVTVSIKLAGTERIESLQFTGKGCSLSQASASMMSELCNGKTLSEASELLTSFSALMSGTVDQHQKEHLGDALALEGVRKFAARIRCVMLAWEALAKCIEEVRVNP
jgi:nitrogen fixation protein NifU and related proteins